MNTAIQSRSSVESKVFQDANAYLSGICFLWIHKNDLHLQRVSWDIY